MIVKKLIFLTLIFICITLKAQELSKNIFNKDRIENFLNSEKVIDNKDWQVLTKHIEEFNNYPKIPVLGQEYIYYYQDNHYLNKEIPVRIYIPSNYSERKKNQTSIYFRGAEKQSSWSQVDRSINRFTSKDSIDYSRSSIVNRLIKEDTQVVIRIVPDGRNGFCFSVNCNRPSVSSYGPKIVSNVVNDIKRFINIDDQKIHIWGHSDGGDGTYLLATQAPSNYATFMIYNSMLTQIFGQTYLGNLINRPAYVVHSDGDNLRKVTVTREQIKVLDSLSHSDLIYTEYKGYDHDDEHLGIDVNSAIKYSNNHSREYFPTVLQWESDTVLYGEIDWLRVDSIDYNSMPEKWHQEVNVRNKFVWKGENVNEPYYYFKKPSGKIVAKYLNNEFNIKTSKIKAFTIKLPAHLVDYSKPISVLVNGESKFNDFVQPSTNYIIKDFETRHDRNRIWVNEINIVL